MKRKVRMATLGACVVGLGWLGIGIVVGQGPQPLATSGVCSTPNLLSGSPFGGTCNFRCVPGIRLHANGAGVGFFSVRASCGNAADAFCTATVESLNCDSFGGASTIRDDFGRCTTSGLLVISGSCSG